MDKTFEIVEVGLVTDLTRGELIHPLGDNVVGATNTFRDL